MAEQWDVSFLEKLPQADLACRNALTAHSPLSGDLILGQGKPAGQ